MRMVATKLLDLPDLLVIMWRACTFLERVGPSGNLPHRGGV